MSLPDSVPGPVSNVDVCSHVDLRFTGQAAQRFVDQNSLRNFKPRSAAAAAFGRQQRPILLQRSKGDGQRRLVVDVGRVTTPTVQNVGHLAEPNGLPVLLRRSEVHLLVLGQCDRLEGIAAVWSQDLVLATLTLVMGPIIHFYDQNV